MTDVLNFPLASTGEPFGLVRRFQPFINRDLERARRHAVTQPRSDSSFTWSFFSMKHGERADFLWCLLILHQALEKQVFSMLAFIKVDRSTYWPKL